MKAADRFNQRPSVMILGKDSKGKRWTQDDISLARAYERYLAELCPQCGLPKYICHNEENAIQFRAVTDQCLSRATADKAQADEEERVSKNPTLKRYGTRYVGEPFLTDEAEEAGREFSDFRRPFLRAEAEKMGLIPPG